MRGTADLRRGILARSAPVVVIGQGYVGLSLACAAAEAGFPVVGIDTDPERLDALSQGRLSVPGLAPSVFDSAVATGRLTFSFDAAPVASARLVFICVPTPLRDQSPDLSFVEEASRAVAEHLKPGTLVVLESTTYPGTTSEVVCPLLETSGLESGKGFLLAYSPERVDPGNDEFSFAQVPRLVGGHTAEATGTAITFYEQLVDKVVGVSSPRAAELAKLLENAFRHANIALVNEMAMLCHEMNIDVWEVIEAAATKPFGFMRFTPGPGVGGHCIPLDPTYLTWQVKRDAGRQFRMLEQAQDINVMMPAWTAERIAEAMSDRGVPLRGASILVLGVAYKPNIGDARESPSLSVMSRLRKRGAKVSFHDPYFEEVVIGDETVRRVELTKRSLIASDCVALLTPHAAYDLDWILEYSNLVFDARNAYGSAPVPRVVRL
jgi:UDP-N-acetyl-D-glucosamine dehydrogenase